jgi:hypothetical protein
MRTYKQDNIDNDETRCQNYLRKEGGGRGIKGGERGNIFFECVGEAIEEHERLPSQYLVRFDNEESSNM